MPIYEVETDRGIYEIDADRQPTTEEAMQAISGQIQGEFAARETARNRAVEKSRASLEEGQPVSAISRGLLAGALTDLPSALANRAAGVSRYDPSNPEFTDPYTYALSEIIGSAIPIGRVAKGGQMIKEALTGGLKQIAKPVLQQGLKKTALQGGLLGAGYGAAQAISEPISDIEQPLDTGELVARGVVGGTIGGTVGAGIPLAIGATKRMTREAGDFLADLMDVRSLPDEKIKIFNQGGYDDAIQALKTEFKGGGVEGGKAAEGKYLTKIRETYQPLVGAMDESILEKQSLVNDFDQSLSRFITNPEEKSSALKSVQSYIDNVKSENILGFSKELNDDVRSLYKSGNFAEATRLKQAKMALRDVFADRIERGIVEGGGDPSEYQRSGRIVELMDNIYRNYEDARATRSQVKGAGFFKSLEAAPGGLSKLGLISRPIRAAKEIAGRGEPARLDSQMNKMFSRVEPLKEMSEAEREIIKSEAYETLEQNIETAVARRGREERGVEYRKMNDKISDLLENLKNKRSKFIKEEGASPSEVQNYLQEQNKLLALDKAIEESIPEAIKIQRLSAKEFSQSVMKRPTDDVLGDMIHFRNKGEFGYSSMLERELERRLGAKKYSKDWSLIKENLGIPQSVEGIDLPRKREILQ